MDWCKRLLRWVQRDWAEQQVREYCDCEGIRLTNNEFRAACEEFYLRLRVERPWKTMLEVAVNRELTVRRDATE